MTDNLIPSTANATPDLTGPAPLTPGVNAPAITAPAITAPRLPNFIERMTPAGDSLQPLSAADLAAMRQAAKQGGRGLRDFWEAYHARSAHPSGERNGVTQAAAPAQVQPGQPTATQSASITTPQSDFDAMWQLADAHNL